MANNTFIAPKFNGYRFKDHTLPVHILEDFIALEDLLIEVAKDIYLKENANRKRVPKGFSDAIYLKLVEIEEGSAVARFALANSASTLPAGAAENISYFEKAKEKIIALIELANSEESPQSTDNKLMSFFNKIGRNLLDDESIDFGYNPLLKEGSKAILNKATRKRLILSGDQKSGYTDSIQLYALVPAINQKNKIFQAETTLGIIKCPLSETIQETVFTAFYEYKNKTYVSLKGMALFSRYEKLQEICEIKSIDLLDPFDVSLRIHELLKLEDYWYEGHGRAFDKEGLNKFGELFNHYFHNRLPLPAIFPKVNGNIQLEWKKGSKNIIVEVELPSLFAEFFYFNTANGSDEKEISLNLSDHSGWLTLNQQLEIFVS